MEFQNERNVLGTVKVCIATVFTSLMITVILMAVLALLICYTPLNEAAVTPTVYILNYFSIFMAGLFSAVKSRKKGFVTGALSGGGYMLLVYLLGYILFGGIDFSKATVMSVLYAVLTGMVGGIVGINISRR